ncbi:MAG: acetone carboxylase subunit gamma [Alphaproteobacteria bacterium]|nr:acetone carboxylase subunit gamma [Alphaproteobacteria bacterium]
MRVRITEYLDIELESERWCCNRCGHDLGDARESYKKGCLVRDRDPREIHFPIGPSKEFNFSFDPNWMRIVEFYCPGCGVMVENEYLPPGHPLTWDIQLDIDKLRQRHGVTGPKVASRAAPATKRKKVARGGATKAPRKKARPAAKATKRATAGRRK